MLYWQTEEVLFIFWDAVWIHGSQLKKKVLFGLKVFAIKLE